jgi:hypothetical protein
MADAEALEPETIDLIKAFNAIDERYRDESGAEATASLKVELQSLIPYGFYDGPMRVQVVDLCPGSEKAVATDFKVEFKTLCGGVPVSAPIELFLVTYKFQGLDLLL